MAVARTIVPSFLDTLEKDIRELSQYVKNNEELFCNLPDKSERTEAENHLANDIKQCIRLARAQFLARHAESVYAFLSDNFKQHYTLSELISHAANAFPYLVPTQEQMLNEQKQIQAHKEGYEIDQGIFFRSILRLPKPGLHLMDAMLLPTQRAISLLDEFSACGQIDLGAVSLQRCEEATYLTINNQYCLNAEDNQLIHAMQVAVDLVLLDPKTKLGILRGGVMQHPRYKDKRVFCSGINLSHLQAGKISFVEFLLERELGYINKIRHGIFNQHTTTMSQKPWIAIVDSFAIGGGMQLLLVVDKVIAVDNVYFSLPAAQEGIIPGAANYRLPRMAGHYLTRQMILSGKKIRAYDDEARWLCDVPVSSQTLDATIHAAIAEFNHPAVVENRKMLTFAEEPRELFRQYMAEFSYLQAERLYSEDVLEKISRWAKNEKAT